MIHVMYYPIAIQMSGEESTLKVRERCVSRTAKRVGQRGQRPRIKSGRQPLRGKAESQEG
eukprot:6213305-Pleurochrysis_carterae.AAC.2